MGRVSGVRRKRGKSRWFINSDSGFFKKTKRIGAGGLEVSLEDFQNCVNGGAWGWVFY